MSVKHTPTRSADQKRADANFAAYERMRFKYEKEFVKKTVLLEAAKSVMECVDATDSQKVFIANVEVVRLRQAIAQVEGKP